MSESSKESSHFWNLDNCGSTVPLQRSKHFSGLVHARHCMHLQVNNEGGLMSASSSSRAWPPISGVFSDGSVDEGYFCSGISSCTKKKLP